MSVWLCGPCPEACACHQCNIHMDTHVQNSASNNPNQPDSFHFLYNSTRARYDGALGIIVGIAAIKEVVLQAAAQAGVALPQLHAGAPVPQG